MKVSETKLNELRKELAELERELTLYMQNRDAHHAAGAEYNAQIAHGCVGKTEARISQLDAVLAILDITL